jgi:hypothetical protein
LFRREVVVKVAALVGAAARAPKGREVMRLLARAVVPVRPRHAGRVALNRKELPVSTNIATQPRRREVLDDVLVRARQVAQFYTGHKVTSRTAIEVLLDRLDEVELRLSKARAALNGNGKGARS